MRPELPRQRQVRIHGQRGDAGMEAGLGQASGLTRAWGESPSVGPSNGSPEAPGAGWALALDPGGYLPTECSC